MGAAGRPREHDRTAIMQKVCERVAAGELVKDVAASLHVDARRIRQWSNEPEFAPLYARAREDQAHAMAEDVIAMADTATAENWQQVRLRIDARKWLASKIAPRAYGERTQQEHSGGITVKLEYVEGDE